MNKQLFAWNLKIYFTKIFFLCYKYLQRNAELIRLSKEICCVVLYIIIIYFFCLDVEGIKYVINFDYPNSSEDYIHRIGRTGRSDSTGTSYAFFTPSNFRQAKDLISVLKEANQVSTSNETKNICCPLIFGMPLLEIHSRAWMLMRGRLIWKICLRCPQL